MVTANETNQLADSRGGAVAAFVRSMRPAQWVKNLIVFAGLLFGQKLLAEGMLLRSVAAFVVFCGLAGAQYVINDVQDIESDRRHPQKSLRPLAAGQIRPAPALLGAVLVVLLSLGAAFWLGRGFGVTALAYFVLGVSYSYVLKHQAILDVFAIALGFVIRAAAGAIVVATEISAWLLVCTFFLALFLALAKRRHEIRLLGSDAAAHRRALADYSPDFLDQMIAVVTTSTVLSYALFTVSTDSLEFKRYGTHLLVYTVPLVLYGIFRYLYLVFRLDQGGSPTRLLLTDRGIQATVVVWIIAVAGIMYRGG